MPGSVTPARRSSSEADLDEDYDVSVDGEETPRANGSKRARVESESDEDEASQSGDGPVLPDSFRRSPKGKGRAANGLTNGATSREPQKHQPGSIVRVTLTDFVTYTKAEFHPGPNLNMIIGPNGTGKSTLVCAICLGLGWSPSHLGRAKDLGEFVKHGAKRGEIEIELAANPGRHDKNPVITTRITKEGNKADYGIDGKKSNKKSVQSLAKSFSIQVDNLCQFLPQDRVVEFAALSPVDLLTQTQRAAAPPHMSDWHDQLKDKRKDQKAQQAEQQRVLETLKNMENRQRLQQADVDRLKERAQLQERISALEKQRPFVEYQTIKRQLGEARTQRKVAARELARLERAIEPHLLAANEKRQYWDRVDKVVGQRRRLMERSETLVAEKSKKIGDLDDKIEECNKQIEAEKTSVKATKQSIPKLNQDLANLQRAMQTPPESFDPAQMNEQMREKSRQVREVEEKISTAQEDVGSLKLQINQRERIVAEAKAEGENLQSQAGKQANQLRRASPDAANAWDWIQKNQDKFHETVYGPPIVECTVKNPAHASAIESMIPDSDKTAFTVTTRADFDKLQQQLYGQLGLSSISIRTALQPLSSFKPPTSVEELQQYGLDRWLLDLIDGPDAVLSMLCDNRNVHQTAFATREISEQQYNALQRSNISSWVTPSQSYLISRRREYGDNATSTRVQPLRPARFFTDAPVDHGQQQAINARIRETEDEIRELTESINERKAEGNLLVQQRKQLLEERKEIEDEKAIKQARQSAFNALPVKEERAKAKLADAHEKLQGFRHRVKAVMDSGDKVCLEKGQLALDYANAVEALRGLHIQLLEVEILNIEAKSDHEQLEEQHANEIRSLQAKQAEVAELSQREERFLAAGRELGETCRALGANFSDMDTRANEEIQGWAPDQLETEIESTHARLEMTAGAGNENTLREFERRGREILGKREKLNELDESLETLETEIAEVRESWEPELDRLVAQISEAFAENFSRIQCAGEVAVHKDEDFEQWAIQIRVKFREQEQLSILDSHRQSGGERAVSTIFYLMALQSLARAPFRVVDEINQGMDPRNERLVHSRMVEIACAEHTSQYFLITPKLLNGLAYHPNMKVHCIASGEYMPADHRELDFGMLAKRALEVRGLSVAG